MEWGHLSTRFSRNNQPDGRRPLLPAGPALSVSQLYQNGPIELGSYQPIEGDWYNFTHAMPAPPLPQPAFFLREEVDILRAAGFDRYARECLSTYPAYRRSFVLRSGPYLRRCGFLPAEQTILSGQPRHLRRFFLDFAELLCLSGFRALDIYELYQMPFGNRQFVISNASLLGSIGFTAPMMTFFSMRSFAERDFVIRNGPSLFTQGIHCAEIVAMARTSYVPAPAGSSLRFTVMAPPAELRQDRAGPSRQNRSTAATPQSSGQIDTEADTAVRDAHSRWGISTSQGSARQFYDQIVPVAFANQISGTEFQDLRLLLAGLAHVEDNRTTDTRERHLERVRSVTEYLSNTGDAEFLLECNSVANDNVGRCGDRVSFGFTGLQQLIERRRVEKNELTARDLLAGVERQFRQTKLEEIADRIAPQPTESVEFYLALCAELRRRGMDLTESTEGNLYGNQFRPSRSQLEQVEQELDAHINTPSPEYLETLSANPGVRDILRRLFPADFSKMDADKEQFGEQADELIFKEDASADEKGLGEEMMRAAIALENDWYKQRAADITWQSSLLDGERVG